MAFLSHILNPDRVDPRENYWAGLLHTDIDHHHELYAEVPELTDGSLQNVQRGMETWAAENLPPSSSEPTTWISKPESSDHEDATSSLCYGMIYGTAAKLFGDMVAIHSKLNHSSCSYAPNHSVFTLRRSDTQKIHLALKDGTELATLNDHMCTTLDKLMDQTDIHLEALAQTATLHERIGQMTKAAEARFRVDIYVYGSPQASAEIGANLSAQKVYLQRPDCQRPGSKYDNPQVLKFPEIDMSTINYAVQSNTGVKLNRATVDQFRKEVSSLYASLTRNSKLERRGKDRRVTTDLLEHQEKALYFMIQREVGPVPPEFSLWKTFQSDGQTVYRHAVTGVKSSVPQSETGGGILADEMGMGKSLSTLSLIATTFDDAHQWAEDEELSQDANHNAIKKRAPVTLIVAPSVLVINEWLNEIKRHLDGTLKAIIYHGDKRRIRIADIKESGMVLTTYHTLMIEFRSKASSLHEIEWYRLVLDEAHTIRRQATKFNRAVSELRAKYRWCLTGTPIQNKLDDIGSLFAFIRARPFDSMAMFRRYVSTPFDESREQREIATKRLALLIDSLCIRRTIELLDLPDHQNRSRIIDFTPEERAQYEQSLKTMNRSLRLTAGDYHSRGIFGIFQIQLQLRILCNHGTFQKPFSWVQRNLLEQKEDALSSAGWDKEITCSSCRQQMPILDTNNVYRSYMEHCAHVLCYECLEEHMPDPGEESQIHQCPLCVRTGVPQLAIKAGDTITVPNNGEEYFQLHGHSSKMTALIADVQEDLDKTKSIIFSCWTRTLNLIAKHLDEASISFKRIDGDCPHGRREKILKQFSRDSKIPVLLMTTGTGAFGLNLTAANRIFMVEPQWNPSVEIQAIARAIRLGQRKNVLVTRYIINKTVEQQMRSQQKRKLDIAEVGWDERQPEADGEFL